MIFVGFRDQTNQLQASSLKIKLGLKSTAISKMLNLSLILSLCLSLAWWKQKDISLISEQIKFELLTDVNTEFYNEHISK